MSVTYSKKNESTQKTSENAAASVLDYSTQSEGLQRKADLANAAAQRAEAPRPNNTGMPDNLKSGIESLSGFSMDDVRVHYNSSKPATVQALAYTQGTDIHVAPGQEKHLPHEAWHVAQQMAGRVSPTTNINGMPVNDNAALEHEADVMGEKAVQCKRDGIRLQNKKSNPYLTQCYPCYNNNNEKSDYSTIEGLQNFLENDVSNDFLFGDEVPKKKKKYVISFLNQLSTLNGRLLQNEDSFTSLKIDDCNTLESIKEKYIQIEKIITLSQVNEISSTKLKESVNQRLDQFKHLYNKTTANKFKDIPVTFSVQFTGTNIALILNEQTFIENFTAKCIELGLLPQPLSSEEVIIQNTIKTLSDEFDLHLSSLKKHIFEGEGSAQDPKGLHAYTDGQLPNGILLTAGDIKRNCVHNISWKYPPPSAKEKNSTMFPAAMPNNEVKAYIIIRCFNEIKDKYFGNADINFDKTATHILNKVGLTDIKLKHPGDKSTVFPVI